MSEPSVIISRNPFCDSQADCTTKGRVTASVDRSIGSVVVWTPCLLDEGNNLAEAKISDFEDYDSRKSDLGVVSEYRKPEPTQSAGTDDPGAKQAPGESEGIPDGDGSEEASKKSD